MDWSAESWVGGLVDLWVNIWLPFPLLPSQALLFLQIGQPMFSRILKSALCVGTVKHRV